MSSIKFVIATAIVAVITMVGAPAMADKVYYPPVLSSYTQPCDWADGSAVNGKRCFWDDDWMGDGTGRSFIAFRGGWKRGGAVRYITDRYAHRLFVTAATSR